MERPGGKVVSADFKTPYIAAMDKFVDLDAIKKPGFKFAIDVMYGSGRGVLKGIFTEAGIDHVEIRSELNPLFPGINPEPIRPMFSCCRKLWSARSALQGLPPTATLTASAPLLKTAASSTPTRSSP